MSAQAAASLAVGLAGAGPWAERAYAPMLAAGPETRLAAVWARRAEAAQALATAHGCEPVASFDALLERCDAVAFAVPPDVQAELGVRAAHAGKAMLLDKPLALTLAEAERLTAAVAEAGVVTQLMLTHRFRSKAAAWIDQARDFGAIGARLSFLTGAFVRGPYACAWRREYGALHDLGPHAFDLLDAALGPIESIVGRGDPRAFVALACRHEGGAVSELALSGVMHLPESVFDVEVYGPGGVLAFDAVAASGEEPWSHARRRFAKAVRSGESHELDARRGLVLQRYIDAALRALDQEPGKLSMQR
ncbi:MAG: Gfo/Idh/MocA family oxidoreductase [Candidatus Eisenbacteria bacterium]